jgi:MFS family permease
MLSMAAAAVGALLMVRVVKLWGTPLVFLLASILLGITTLAIPLIHDVSLLKAAMLFNGLGRGCATTIVMSLGIQAASPQQRATAMGIFQAALAVGMLLGPLLSGFIAQSWGLASVFYLSTFCYLAPCLIAYLPAVKRLESQ